jgi:hypothetical protein
LRFTGIVTHPHSGEEKDLMKTKTRIRAGGIRYQHNETLVCDVAKGQGLKVKTHVRAGGG